MLSSSKRGRRSLLIPFVLAGLGAGLVGATPVAAGNSVFTTFRYELFDDHVEGSGPANTELKVTLRGADGEYQGHYFATSDGGGNWDAYFWGDINPGDRITATDGSTSRTVTVQPVSFQVNRVTDVVSGKSVPNSQVAITIYNCYSDFDDCFNTGTFNRNTNGQGNFSYDSTNNYNVRGNDYLNVEWESPQGDVAERFLDVPSVNAWVGNNEAWGDAKPRQDVTVWLFNSQGTQKAKFKDRGDAWDGEFDGMFNANGHAVNVRAGDFIGSNIASDALWQTVASNATFNTATDVVTGKCFNGKPFTVYAYKQNVNSAYTGGTANNNGSFSVNLMSTNGYDLESGDTVEIGCSNATGDEQYTDYEVQ